MEAQYTLSLGLDTGLAKPDVDGLGNSLARVGREADAVLTRTGRSTGAVDRFGASSRRAAEGVNAASRATDRWNLGLGRSDTVVGKITRGLIGLAAAYLSVAGASRAITGTARDFMTVETALVGVAKTTGIVGPELRALYGDITALATDGVPLATNSLIELGQVSGQLGVKGSDNLLRYIGTLGKLSAATDVIGEEGAKNITRLMNVQGEGPANIEKLGAALVGLGNDAAASESEILDLGTEVGLATAQFRIGSVAAISLGTALKESGVDAEAGGTSIGRTLREIQKAVFGGGDALREFAFAANVSAADFKAAWEEGPLVAFDLLFKGISRFGAESSLVFAKLGLGSDRLAKTLPTLAANYDRLHLRLEQGKALAEEGTALEREAAAAFDTTASDLQRLSNAYTATSAVVGEGMSPAIRALTVDLRAYLTTNRAAAEEIGANLGSAVEFLSSLLLTLLENLGLVRAALVAWIATKVALWVAGLTASLFGATAATTAYTTATLGAAAATTSLGTAVLTTGPAVWSYSAGMTAAAGSTTAAAGAATRFMGVGIHPMIIALGILAGAVLAVRNELDSLNREMETDMREMAAETAAFADRIFEHRRQLRDLTDEADRAERVDRRLLAAGLKPGDPGADRLAAQVDAEIQRERVAGLGDQEAALESVIETERRAAVAYRESIAEVAEAEAVLKRASSALQENEFNTEGVSAGYQNAITVLGEAKEKLVENELALQRASIEAATLATTTEGLREAAEGYVPVLEEEAEGLDLVTEAEQKRLDKLRELHEELDSEIRANGALADAYALGERAVRDATRSMEIEQRVRAAGIKLSKTEEAAVRAKVTAAVDAERRLSGEAAIDALDRQVVAQRAINAAYADGLPAVEAARQAVELEAAARDNAAGAAENQRQRIAELSADLARDQAADRALQLREQTREQVEDLSRLAAARLLDREASAAVVAQVETEAAVRRESVGVLEEERAAVEAQILARQRLSALDETARQIALLREETQVQLALAGVKRDDFLTEEAYQRALAATNVELRVKSALLGVEEQRLVAVAALRRDATLGEAELAEKIGETNRAYAAAAEATEELIRVQGDLAQQQAETNDALAAAQQAWGNFVEGIQRDLVTAIEGLFDEGLSSAEDFVDALVDLGKRLVAEWLGFLAVTGFEKLADLAGGGSSAPSASDAAANAAISELTGAVTAAAGTLVTAGGAAGAQMTAGGTAAGGFMTAGGTGAGSAVAVAGAVAGGEFTSGAAVAGGTLIGSAQSAGGGFIVSTTQAGAILIQAAGVAGAELAAGGAAGGAGSAVGGVAGGVVSGGGGFMGLSAGAWGAIAGAVAVLAIAYFGGIYLRGERGKKFDPAQTIGVEGGVRKSNRFGSQLDEFAAEWNRVLDSIEELTGGVVESLPEIGLQIRRDGKFIKAYVAGVFIGTFRDLAEAAAAAMKLALASADISGVADEILQVLRLPFADIEELMANLAIVQAQVDLSLDLSPFQKGMEDFLRAQAQAVEEFERIGVSTRLVFDNTIAGLARFYRELMGIEDDARSQQLRDADAYNDERAKFEADLLERLAGAEALLFRAMEAAARLAEGLAGRTDQQTEAWRELAAQIPAITALIADLNAQLGELPPAIDPADLPNGKGDGSGRRRAEERKEIRAEMEDLALLASGIADSAVGLRRDFTDFDEWIENARRLGIAEDELAAARRNHLAIAEREFLGQFEGRQAGIRRPEGAEALADLQRDYRAALDEAMELARRAAELNGTTVEAEFARLSAAAEEVFGFDAAGIIADRIRELAEAGDVAGLEELRRYVEELIATGDLPPGVADAFRDLIAAGGELERSLAEVRDGVMESVRQYTDAVLGIGEFQRKLLDLQEQFSAARGKLQAAEDARRLGRDLAAGGSSEAGDGEGLRRATAPPVTDAERGLRRITAATEAHTDAVEDAAAGQLRAIAVVDRLADATDDLADDMGLLAAAEMRAVQQLGVDFLRSLDRLGVSLPTELVLELAQAEFELARAEAIAGAIALAAAGAFDGLSISLDELLGLLAGADFDASGFAPRAPAGGGGGDSGGPSPAEELAEEARRFRVELEGQVRAWRLLEFGPLAQEAVDLRRRLEELTARAARLGEETTGLAAAYGVALEAFVDEALAPFADLGLDPLQAELNGIVAQFTDIALAMEVAGANAEQLARLQDRFAAAMADFLERATEGIRDLIEELRATDPRRSSEQRFLGSQDAFRELLTRAQGGDLEAIQQLEAAARAYRTEGTSFLGGGVASLAVLDEILAGLESIGDVSLVPEDIQLLQEQLERLRELVAISEEQPTAPGTDEGFNRVRTALDQQRSTLGQHGLKLDSILAAIEDGIELTEIDDMLTALGVIASVENLTKSEIGKVLAAVSGIMLVKDDLSKAQLLAATNTLVKLLDQAKLSQPQFDKTVAELMKIADVSALTEQNTDAVFAALGGLLRVKDDLSPAQLTQLQSLVARLLTLEGLSDAQANTLWAMLGELRAIETNTDEMRRKTSIGVATTVPQLDRGGLVVAEGLAFVHAGEIVMTPEQTQSFYRLLAATSEAFRHSERPLATQVPPAERLRPAGGDGAAAAPFLVASLRLTGEDRRALLEAPARPRPDAPNAALARSLGNVDPQTLAALAELVAQGRRREQHEDDERPQRRRVSAAQLEQAAALVAAAEAQRAEVAGMRKDLKQAAPKAGRK